MKPYCMRGALSGLVKSWTKHSYIGPILDMPNLDWTNPRQTNSRQTNLTPHSSNPTLDRTNIPTFDWTNPRQTNLTPEHLRTPERSGSDRTSPRQASLIPCKSGTEQPLTGPILDSSPRPNFVYYQSNPETDQP